MAEAYKYRFHAVECLVREGLIKEGFRVKELKIKDRQYINDYISVQFWLKRPRRPRGRRGRRSNGQGGYESDSSGCDCCA